MSLSDEAALRHLIAARLSRIFKFAADAPYDLVTCIWEYFPLARYPNSSQRGPICNLPRWMLTYKCESTIDLKAGQMIGMMVSPTFIGPARVQLLEGLAESQQGPRATDITTFQEITLIEAGHAGCVLKRHFYYFIFDQRDILYRIPLDGRTATSTVINVPEGITDLRVADGKLFLIAQESFRVYVMDDENECFNYVMTMTIQGGATNSDEGGDEDDADWFSDPRFQDAIVEDARPVAILFIKGGTWGKLCVWKEHGVVFESPERHAEMCRFIPRIGSQICFGVFTTGTGSRGYVYHIYDDLILSPNVLPPNESIASMCVSDGWTVLMCTNDIVIDSEVGFSVLRNGLKLIRLFYRPEGSCVCDGSLLDRQRWFN